MNWETSRNRLILDVWREMLRVVHIKYLTRVYLFGLHTGKGTCFYQHWTIKPKRRKSTENAVTVIVPIPGEMGTGSVYRTSVYVITTLYDV